MRRTLVALVAASIGGAPALRAQEPGAPGRRWSGYSFVSARYLTRKSLTLLAGQRAGPVMVVVGARGKPTSHNWTALVGPGTHLRVSPGISVTSLLVLGAARDSRSLDLYGIPSIRYGDVRLDAVITLRQPLDRSLRREVAVNPVVVSAAIVPGVRLGFGATITAVEGSPIRAGVGFHGEIRVAGGTVGGGAFAQQGRLETRLAYGVRF